MQRSLYAIMLDGGFLTKKLHAKLGRHATADDVMSVCERLQRLPEVSNYELLRIYYYDAAPSSESLKYPVSKTNYNLSTTERYRQAQSLFDQLVLKPHVALRMGEVRLSPEKWNIKPRAARDLLRAPRPLQDDDFILDISQKGVDMRIGMDMARLALREMVRAVVVVTGDSDFVPAFKFVRREGVKVFLDPMGSNVRVELKQHSDVVLDLDARPAIPVDIAGGSS
ncbi:NYN domain-containing protein [Methylobacterium sp. J-077]|uniref:NYN domain-containing protein n=1 Tax=Methylobacterium sp. J-077 TaxID=2836656 RepID=UPI001FB9F08B|nr:NYN domain-containing protein [Methylobacterium sp. J-077]MCJ2121127.1 NYN domain-containing protein [Methylobacterium sp. J-077]